MHHGAYISPRMEGVPHLFMTLPNKDALKGKTDTSRCGQLCVSEGLAGVVLQCGQQLPVHHHVGISPDGGGEVSVVLQSQAKMGHAGPSCPCLPCSVLMKVRAVMPLEVGAINKPLCTICEMGYCLERLVNEAVNGRERCRCSRYPLKDRGCEGGGEGGYR